MRLDFETIAKMTLIYGFVQEAEWWLCVRSLAEYCVLVGLWMRGIRAVVPGRAGSIRG